jgi:hypothetical protein
MTRSVSQKWTLIYCIERIIQLLRRKAVKLIVSTSVFPFFVVFFYFNSDSAPILASSGICEGIQAKFISTSYYVLGFYLVVILLLFIIYVVACVIYKSQKSILFVALVTFFAVTPFATFFVGKPPFLSMGGFGLLCPRESVFLFMRSLTLPYISGVSTLR